MIIDPSEIDLERLAQLEKEQDAHYAAIGRVAVNWAFFEHNIDGWCMRLANLPFLEAKCLTAQISPAGRKLDAFIALVDILCKDNNKLVQRLHKFAQGVTSLGEQRNRAIHDPWLLISPKEKAMRFEVTARRKLRVELVTMPTDEVLRLADNIKALDDRFTELALEADEARLPTLPDKEPE